MEYEEEGISVDKIKYNDNFQTLDLIKGRMGVIDLLNKECLMLRPNKEQYVSKVYQHNETYPFRVLRSILRFNSCVAVTYTRFVKGVIRSQSPFPKYS